MDIRIDTPNEHENEQIAALWHRAWHEGHDGIVPAELIARRTAASFPDRVRSYAGQMRIAIAEARVGGLCICRGDELYQLFVGAEWRGKGLASALMTDAEHRLLERGVDVAWLACAVGNARAIGFYRKAGWVDVARETERVETLGGHFEIPVLRFEKRLGVR